jgi:hypothetical protein
MLGWFLMPNINNQLTGDMGNELVERGVIEKLRSEL